MEDVIRRADAAAASEPTGLRIEPVDEVRELFEVLDLEEAQTTRGARDVAIHPQSPTYHDPDAVDHLDHVYYVTPEAASRAGIEQCPYCDPSARRATIEVGPGGAD